MVGHSAAMCLTYWDDCGCRDDRFGLVAGYEEGWNDNGKRSMNLLSYECIAVCKKAVLVRVLARGREYSSVCKFECTSVCVRLSVTRRSESTVRPRI